MSPELDVEGYTSLLDNMTSSISATRNALQRLREDQSTLDVRNGISLLSLKHHSLISYLRALALLSSRRTLGQSLLERSPPADAFSSKHREPRGNHAGDLVDSLIESRVVLEKVDILEAKMKYQIERLIRLSDEPNKTAAVADDPLSFRPNPMALSQGASVQVEAVNKSNKFDFNVDPADGIYRPPRLAPVPYNETSKSQKRRDRAPVPSGLSTLAADPSRPVLETTSGLGGMPSLGSGRADYLRRLKDYEEENFTRLVMKKKDARKRDRDEEDLALGGDLGGSTSSRRRQRAGGLEDEFSGVLKSVGRLSGTRFGDGYEDLRNRGKKQHVLERSRSSAGDGDLEDETRQPRKRTRFESEAKATRRNLQKRK